MLGLEGGTGKRAISRWHLARCLPYEDLEASKDLGLDHYQVRSFIGWYRHSTLVLLAHANFPGVCAQQVPVASPACAPQIPATHDAASEGRPLLPLTVPEVRHLLGCLIWPGPGGDAGTGALPAISTPSAVWRPADSRSRSSFGTSGGPSSLFPDFQDISWKSGSSRIFPGSAVRLVYSFVFLRKES